MTALYILEKGLTRKIVCVEGYTITVTTEDIWLRKTTHVETFSDNYINVLSSLQNNGFEIVYQPY